MARKQKAPGVVQITWPERTGSVQSTTESDIVNLAAGGTLPSVQVPLVKVFDQDNALKYGDGGAPPVWAVLIKVNDVTHVVTLDAAKNDVAALNNIAPTSYTSIRRDVVAANVAERDAAKAATAAKAVASTALVIAKGGNYAELAQLPGFGPALASLVRERTVTTDFVTITPVQNTK